MAMQLEMMVECAGMRALISERACQENQRTALWVAQTILAGVDRLLVMDGHGLSRFRACAGCCRCPQVGMEDVRRAIGMLRQAWVDFEREPLEYYDEEVIRARHREREARKWQRRREKGYHRARLVTPGDDDER